VKQKEEQERKRQLDLQIQLQRAQLEKIERMQESASVPSPPPPGAQRNITLAATEKTSASCKSAKYAKEFKLESLRYRPTILIQRLTIGLRWNL